MTEPNPAKWRPTARRRIDGQPTGGAPTAHTAAGIQARVAEVIDPLALCYRGWPAEIIRAGLSRAWLGTFGPLNEPALTWCATAIRAGRPWRQGMCAHPRARP